MAILGLMALVARRHGLDAVVTWTFLFLVTLNLSPFFPVRPQLFSFGCCAVMLYILERAFAGWPQRLEPKVGWLWILPAVMVVWVNAHGGVVAGFCILLPYLAGRAIELFIRKGSAAWESVRHLALVGAASLAAVVINPYGLELPLWLAHSLSLPRPEVTEWAPIKPSDPMFVPFLLLCGMAVAAFAFDRRRCDWTRAALLVPVAWQACLHVRHVAFFALLCGFWLPELLSGLASRFRGERTHMPDIVLAPWLRRSLTAVLVAVFCLQTYSLTRRVSELPVYRNMYPVDAIEFMANRGLEGRLVVSFNWAQYALAALSPEIRLQFDGRYDTCYPPKAIDRHFDFLLGEHEGRRFRHPHSGPIDGTAVLRDDEPDLVLVDRGYPEAEDNIQREIATYPDKWVLLYQDGIAQLYGRSQRFDNPESPDYLPPPDRLVSDVKHEGAVPWPALPAHATSHFVAHSLQESPSGL
jgi:hypothetical protein